MGMTKTPDEIKKGLECKKRVFADSCYDRCATCELFIPCYGTVERCADAIALIQQLQAENAEKDARIQQLEAERDAAIENIRGDCVYCLHLCEDMVAPSCFDCANKGYYRWEWRGVQKD